MLLAHCDEHGQQDLLRYCVHVEAAFGETREPVDVVVKFDDGNEPVLACADCRATAVDPFHGWCSRCVKAWLKSFGNRAWVEADAVRAIRILREGGALALEWCEIYRDGGSFGAVLRGERWSVSVWLQVGPWDHPSQLNYQALHVSSGDRPEARALELEPASAEERAWLDALTVADISRATPDSREVWINLLDVLRARDP